MAYWETLWSFETANFRIEWAISPDDKCDTSFDETGETAEKIASGLWSCFNSRMRVIHKPTGTTLGEDYLGGSIYEKPAEFRDHIGARGRWGSYFRNMVSEAIKESRRMVAKMQDIKLKAACHG